MSATKTKYVREFIQENDIEYTYNLFKEQIAYLYSNPQAFENPKFVEDCKKIFNPSFKVPSLKPDLNKNKGYQRKNCSVTDNGAFYNWVITDATSNKNLQLQFNTAEELCRSGIKPTADNAAGCEKYRGIKDFKPRKVYNSSVSLTFSEFISGKADIIPDLPEDTKYEDTRIIEKDSVQSLLFQVLYIINAIIENEWNLSIQNGTIFLEFLVEKKKESPSITAGEALDQFNQEYPNIHSLAQIIIDDKDRAQLIKLYKKEGINILLDGILVVAVKEFTKCVSKNTIGDEDKPLAMRFFTAKIPHQSDGFFNRDTVKISNFNESFKQNKLDDPVLYNTFNPSAPNFITANNIDSIILPKSVISGKFYLKCSSHPKGFSVSLVTEEFMVATVEPVAKKKAVAVRIPTGMLAAMTAAAASEDNNESLDDDASLDVEELQADLNSVFEAFGIESNTVANAATSTVSDTSNDTASPIVSDTAASDEDNL